jgi:hypothetical protein
MPGLEKKGERERGTDKKVLGKEVVVAGSCFCWVLGGGDRIQKGGGGDGRERGSEGARERGHS